MKEFVINLLTKHLPPNYYYHSLAHSLYVQEKAVEIGTHENCTDAEIILLSAAGLWHDTGFIHIYNGHEEESCVLVRQYLPGFGFSEEDIDCISDIIMATKMPQSPHDHLGEIIADADLEYLGTKLVDENADHLFNELQAFNPSLSANAWDQSQIAFLRQHNYFTDYCKKNKEPGKRAYLNKLLQREKQR